MKNKNKIIILSVIFVLVIGVISIFLINKVSLIKKEQAVKNKYETHIASTRIERVGGVDLLFIDSDLIIDIPEDAFMSFNDRDHSDMTYDDVISEFGEPNGSCGMGLIRWFWRIGEDKYAVCDCIGFYFFICDGQDVIRYE